MKDAYKEIRKQSAELIELVGNAFEDGELTNDQFKELARNNFMIQKCIGLNIGVLELKESRDNEILQIPS